MGSEDLAKIFELFVSERTLGWVSGSRIQCMTLCVAA